MIEEDDRTTTDCENDWVPATRREMASIIITLLAGCAVWALLAWALWRSLT